MHGIGKRQKKREKSCDRGAAGFERQTVMSFTSGRGKRCCCISGGSASGGMPAAEKEGERMAHRLRGRISASGKNVRMEPRSIVSERSAEKHSAIIKSNRMKSLKWLADANRKAERTSLNLIRQRAGHRRGAFGQGFKNIKFES